MKFSLNSKRNTITAKMAVKRRDLIFSFLRINLKEYILCEVSGSQNYFIVLRRDLYSFHVSPLDLKF